MINSVWMTSHETFCLVIRLNHAHFDKRKVPFDHVSEFCISTLILYWDVNLFRKHWPRVILLIRTRTWRDYRLCHTIKRCLWQNWHIAYLHWRVSSFPIIFKYVFPVIFNIFLDASGLKRPVMEIKHRDNNPSSHQKGVKSCQALPYSGSAYHFVILTDKCCINISI